MVQIYLGEGKTMFEDSTKAKLIKVDPATLSDRIAHGYFHEIARWDVFLDNMNLGQVWKTQDNRGRTCWGICVSFLSDSIHMGKAVISGYNATTKKGAVWDLFQWHKNRHRSFELDSVTYHCGRHFDRYSVEEMSFLAEFPSGLSKYVHATHVKEEKPHQGAMRKIGWYASTRRGNTSIYARYCETLSEALSLIRPEAEKPLTKEDKDIPLYRTMSVDLVGSLVNPPIKLESTTSITI
jgi:hypothetical protein